jgi:hypothetical protein
MRCSSGLNTTASLLGVLLDPPPPPLLLLLSSSGEAPAAELAQHACPILLVA